MSLFRYRFRPLLFDVIHSNGPPTQLHPVKIIDGKDGAALVFVTDKAKSFRLSRFPVPHQVDIRNFAVLAENRQ